LVQLQSISATINTFVQIFIEMVVL